MRCLLLGDLLGGGRLAGDALGDGGLLVVLLLVLEGGALLVLAVLLLGGGDALDEALLLNEEGAEDAVLDLIVGEDTTVGAGDGLANVGGLAGLNVGEGLGATNALVTHGPGGVDTLGRLVVLLGDELVAGGANNLDAVAAGGVVAAAAVGDTRARGHCVTHLS